MAVKARVNKIVGSSYVDGPGHRTVLFLQGCSIGCPACQSGHLWSADGGQELEVGKLANLLLTEAQANQDRGLNITISGGEPFQQPYALAKLGATLKARGAHLICYTGYTYEHLTSRGQPPAVIEALSHIDVLVDGPYIYRLDSPDMQYRGSKNQRPIDLNATRAGGEPVVLDLDRPELILTGDGRIVTTGPVADMLVAWGMGEVKLSRRCGQSRGDRQRSIEAGQKIW